MILYLQALRKKNNAHLFKILQWKEWLLIGREDIGLLMVRIIEICAGRFESAGLILTQPGYDRLAHLLSSICHRLTLIQRVRLSYFSFHL